MRLGQALWPGTGRGKHENSYYANDLDNALFRTGMWIVRSWHQRGQCGLRDPKLSLNSPALQALTFARTIRQVGSVTA